jgi:ribosomal protein S8
VRSFTYFSRKGKSGDTLRDLFSRLKEGSKTKKAGVTIPYSKMNAAVLLKFYSKGILANYVYSAGLNAFQVTLKYDFNGNGLLDSLEWVSSVSRRVSYKNKFLYKLDTKHFYLFSNEKGLFFFDELSNTTSGGEYLCKLLC